METVSTPRIDARYLDSYVGRNIVLVGKVLQLRGDTATLDSANPVTALLNRGSHLTGNNMAQIIGKVNPDLTIKVLSSEDLGSNYDFTLYEAVVDVTHKLPGVFIYQ